MKHYIINIAIHTWKSRKRLFITLCIAAQQQIGG